MALGYFRHLIAGLQKVAVTERFLLSRRNYLLNTIAIAGYGMVAWSQPVMAQTSFDNTIRLNGRAGGKRFDGIGVVNGGGATSVLLKDYPEPQRSQILDFLYKPKFGASVSSLLVEIPGDGNSTQGSMPSHMHTRDDLNYYRGYTWWILQEAKKRNPKLSLDGTGWSAPGWVGDNGGHFDKNGESGHPDFFSQDGVDYYIKWLEGLRNAHGLELEAIGCRNEKGVNYDFAKALKKALTSRGFENVKLHAFDNWGGEKLDFVPDLLKDKGLRDSIDIISAHTFSEIKISPAVQAAAEAMGKPIWNSEDHIYIKGFDCALGIVQCFNRNYIESGVTKVVNWYDIAGVYPIEPYSEDPSALLAREPWSGHYSVREALWGYAHYGQFSEIGWTYLNGGSGTLSHGGTYVTLKSPGEDYSVILETRNAKVSQIVKLEVGAGLSTKALCLWKSNAAEQFMRQADLVPTDGAITLTLEPDSIYSLSTTTGQQKGSFADIPKSSPFPFPYYEKFGSYASPKQVGYLPHYTADILGAFELTNRPDKKSGTCLRQVVPVPTISWAPEWQPYTILGDASWADYEVSADVWLNPADTVGVMGRLNHVGTGYGITPKGYFLELSDTGICRLVAIRGKKNPKELVGDAEQQRLIAAGKFEGEGGELVLANAQVPISHGKWIKLMLRMEGTSITGYVDGKQVVAGTSQLYGTGMAGLLAGQAPNRTSTPFFDSILINPVRGKSLQQRKAQKGYQPLYS